MIEGTKIQASNRDAAAALAGLRVMVKERGFPDHDDVIAVGRTIRRLQVVVDEKADQQQMLVQAHARTDEDGKPLEVTGAGVPIKDPGEFLKESRALENTLVEVEIFPITLAVLGPADDRGRGKKCIKCKQLTGLPEPDQLAVLLDLGILVEGHATS